MRVMVARRWMTAVGPFGNAFGLPPEPLNEDSVNAAPAQGPAADPLGSEPASLDSAADMRSVGPGPPPHSPKVPPGTKPSSTQHSALGKNVGEPPFSRNVWQSLTQRVRVQSPYGEIEQQARRLDAAARLEGDLEYSQEIARIRTLLADQTFATNEAVLDAVGKSLMSVVTQLQEVSGIVYFDGSVWRAKVLEFGASVDGGSDVKVKEPVSDQIPREAVQYEIFHTHPVFYRSVLDNSIVRAFSADDIIAGVASGLREHVFFPDGSHITIDFANAPGRAMGGRPSR